MFNPVAAVPSISRNIQSLCSVQVDQKMQHLWNVAGQGPNNV